MLRPNSTRHKKDLIQSEIPATQGHLKSGKEGESAYVNNRSYYSHLQSYVLSRIGSIKCQRYNFAAWAPREPLQAKQEPHS
jgi:hypothetical protein